MSADMEMRTQVLGKEVYIKLDYMGKDLNVRIAGGDQPHIGSVSIAVPRGSLTGEGDSATVSTYVFPGHKDDVIGNMYAEALCKQQKCKVVVSCGLHYDRLDSRDIKVIYEEMAKLLEAGLSEWEYAAFDKE